MPLESAFPYKKDDDYYDDICDEPTTNFIKLNKPIITNVYDRNVYTEY